MLKTNSDRKKYIIITKMAVLVLAALNTLAGVPEEIGQKPFIWVYPAVAILSFFFTIIYFKLVSRRHNLQPGKFTTFSFSIFLNPLPFYHFVALCVLLQGLCGIMRGLLFDIVIDMPSLILLSSGIGIYLSVLVANKVFADRE